MKKLKKSWGRNLFRCFNATGVTAIAYFQRAVIFIYANSEPQPNAKYSCAASVAIAR